MTRGKIIYMGQDGWIYETEEFPEKMGTGKEEYGRRMINLFSYGGLRSLEECETYVQWLAGTAQRSRRKQTSGIKPVVSYDRSKGLLLEPGQWEYLYVINGMDTAATIGFVGEKIGTILPVDVMAVIHGAVVEKLIYRRGDHGDPLVSETEFCEILEKLQKDRDLAEDFDLLLKRAGKKEGRSLDGSVMSICHEGEVIRLLELLMRDSGGEISYFVYELDFGRRYEPGMVTDGEGEVDLSCSQALYRDLVRTYF